MAQLQVTQDSEGRAVVTLDDGRLLLIEQITLQATTNEPKLKAHVTLASKGTWINEKVEWTTTRVFNPCTGTYGAVKRIEFEDGTVWPPAEA